MQSHEPIGPKRYRKTFGRYYDDFVVGDVYEHRPSRTITESDNTWFTLLTMNTHPLHFDKVYAAKSEFKRPIVNSCLTLSMVVGMSVSDITEGHRQSRMERHQVDCSRVRRGHDLRRIGGAGEA